MLLLCWGCWPLGLQKCHRVSSGYFFIETDLAVISSRPLSKLTLSMARFTDRNPQCPCMRFINILLYELDSRSPSSVWVTSYFPLFLYTFTFHHLVLNPNGAHLPCSVGQESVPTSLPGVPLSPHGQCVVPLGLYTESSCARGFVPEPPTLIH